MSEMVVVDVSLALKWVIPESDSGTAIGLLDKWTNEGTTVIAPALFAYEVTNIIYRQSKANKLTLDEANKSLKKLFSMGILLKFSLYEDISAQAMEFARIFDLPATFLTAHNSLSIMCAELVRLTCTRGWLNRWVLV